MVTTVVKAPDGQEVTRTSAEIPPEELAQLYLAGATGIDEGTRIPVQSSVGAVGTVSLSGLRNALRSGYKLSNSGQLAEAERAATYGTAGQQAITAAEGAADTLTLGLYRPVAAEAAGLMAGDNSLSARVAAMRAMEAREEINPGAAIGGAVAGAVLPEILTLGGATALEGASIGGRIARTATALPRMAAEGGRAAEVAVAELVGAGKTASPIGKVMSRLISGAAGGAAEALPYAVGHGYAEAYANPEASAERILAGIGLETLAGGVAGGIFGGGSAALAEAKPLTSKAAGTIQNMIDRLRPADVEAAAARMFDGHVANGLGDKAVDLAATLSTGDRGAIRSLATGDGEGLLSAEARRRRAVAVYDSKEIRDKAVDQMRAHLDTLMDVTDAVTDEARGTLKTEQIRKLVADADHVGAMQTAKQSINELGGTIEQMLAKPDSFGEVKRMNDILAATRHAQSRIEQAEVKFGEAYKAGGLLDSGMQEATSAAFSTLDDLKRQIGRARNLRGAQMPSGRDGATLGELENIYEGFRTRLEDTGTWGKAATAQKEINSKWTEMLGIQRQFRDALTTNVGRSSTNPWADSFRSDPERIAKYLDGITNPEKDLVHGFVKRYTDASAELVQKISDNYELPEHLTGVGGKAREAVDGLHGVTKEVEGALVLKNQLKQLIEDTSGTNGLGGAAVMGMLGAAIGGGLGDDLSTPVGIAGAAAGLLMSPGRGIRQLAALERVMGNAARKLDGRVARHVRSLGSGKAGKALQTAREAAYRLPPALRSAGTAIASTSRGVATVGSVQEANRLYTKTRDDISEATSDPVAWRQGVDRSLAPLAEVSPAVVKAAGDKAAAALKFLATKLPTSAPPDPLTPQLREVKPPDYELVRFARYVKAVQDPSVLVDELERGSLSLETVEAVKSVYPETYEQVRQTILNELSKAKHPLPYQERTRLEILLGIPASGSDPQLWQRLQVPPPEDPKRPTARRGGGGSALKAVASTYQTTLNKLEV